jgi:prepilin-type N-terminal cleavage/methylation domain-containing protein/prepilin-type processing-associated H-X9-DG protein
MRRAFTLIELLITVALIALLVAIMLPALHRARQEARQTACMANLHFLAIATDQYLADSREAFWRYYWTVPDGRLWWFGFEPNGPGSGPYRPIDKSRAVLTPYLGTSDNRLQCPSFPYGDPCVFPKFAEPTASFGMNLVLGPVSGSTRRRVEYLGREAKVFIFADACHFDFGPLMNEGHYVSWMPSAAGPGGYGHFRHRTRANVLYLDAHVAPQRLRGPVYPQSCAGPAANLCDDAGENSIYGM